MNFGVHIPPVKGKNSYNRQANVISGSENGKAGINNSNNTNSFANSQATDASSFPERVKKEVAQYKADYQKQFQEKVDETRATIDSEEKNQAQLGRDLEEFKDKLYHETNPVEMEKFSNKIRNLKYQRLGKHFEIAALRQNNISAFTGASIYNYDIT